MVALDYDPMVSSNVGSGLGPGIRCGDRVRARRAPRRGARQRLQQGRDPALAASLRRQERVDVASRVVLGRPPRSRRNCGAWRTGVWCSSRGFRRRAEPARSPARSSRGGAGHGIHLLQWDVARPVFEASPAGQRYPRVRSCPLSSGLRGGPASRHVEIVSLDVILPTGGFSVYDFAADVRSLVPTEEEAAAFIATVEGRDPAASVLEREIGRWWEA